MPANEHRHSYSEVARTPPRTRSQSPNCPTVSPGTVLEAIADLGGVTDSIHSPLPKQPILLDAGSASSPLNKGNPSSTGDIACPTSDTSTDTNHALHYRIPNPNDGTTKINLTNVQLSSSIATANNKATVASVHGPEESAPASTQPRCSG